MARVQVTVSGADSIERVIRRLKFGSRPVGPVVEHFAREFKKSIDTDFKVGGRLPFRWAANARNTIAAKGHGRQLEGKHGPRLRDATRVTATESSAPTKYQVDVHVPAIGALHQAGRTSPWTISPKPGGVLRFVVAEAQEDFIARRKRALKRRRGGSVRTKVPSAPGKVVIFTNKPVRHPGIPARKFVVIREGLLREGWRLPLRAFLFEGKVPA